MTKRALSNEPSKRLRLTARCESLTIDLNDVPADVISLISSYVPYLFISALHLVSHVFASVELTHDRHQDSFLHVTYPDTFFISKMICATDDV